MNKDDDPSDPSDPFGLFGGGARRDDPDTSWDAAYSDLAGRAKDRRLVFDVYAAHPNGLTDYDLAAITGRQQNSVGKRRGELRDHRLIAATDMRRAAPSGSMCIVWVLTDAGWRMHTALNKEKRP